MSVSATNNTNKSSNATDVTKNNYDSFNDVGIEDFLKLMTTELQNQDPLNPMDNAQMLAQIGQIREIASNDSLTNTLESVMLGQNMATASGMISQTVEAMDNEGTRFTGKVTKVTIADGVPTLQCTETIPEYVDTITGETVAEQTIEHSVKLENVYGVVPADQIEKVDPALLAQQLSVASGLIGKKVVATGGEEIVEKDDGEGNITESREEVTTILAGVVEKTVVEDGQAKVQILVPAGEVTEEDPEPKDRRYVVSLSDVDQVDTYALTEDLAIASSMVGRYVTGSVTDVSGNPAALHGWVEQVYVEDGKAMLALKQSDGNLYRLGLDEIANVYGYGEDPEVTATP